MIELRVSKPNELSLFAAMEIADDTAEYIFGWDVERHLAEFQKQEVIYLSILSDDELAGFFILAIESDGESVEFRRIVVSNEKRGVGQAAIAAMEQYCRSKLKRRNIWLDVLEANDRGRHIYKKLGYQFFKNGNQDGKPLLFYQKVL